MKIRGVLITLITFVALVSSAFGQTINNLTSASGLTGAEYFPIFQTANPAKKTTASAIATYVFGLANGDCTITSLGFVTCTKTNGTSFGTFATQNYATPPAIGGTTPNSGAFTTLSATGAISGAGFTAYLASPPPIGGTAPAAGTFTALSASSTITTNVTGSTQCLQVNASGVVSGTGALCGGSGSTGANPTATASDVAVNGVATTFMRSDAAPAVQKGSSSQFGLVKCDGVTITCPGGVLASGGAVVAGTTQTVTATQWNGSTTFVVTTAAQTLTLPVSSSLSVNGGIAIQTIGQSVTLAPNAADAINGGTTGASITVAPGLTAFVTTDGVNGMRVSPTTVGTGSPGGSSGQIQYNNSGAFGGLTIGPTLANNAGTLDTAGSVAAGTTQTVTATQWRAGTVFRVTSAAQTLTLPASTTLNVNGGLAIQTIGQSVTLTPNAADAINGGTTGASVTIASGLTSFVTTDGAGNISASPTTNSGSGTVTTSGTPASGNLAKFSGSTVVTNGDLSGDVTTSGTLAATIANNAVTTAKINNSAVTYAKVQNGASNGLLGVNSGAAPSEIAVGSGLSLSAGTLSATGGGSGIQFTDGTHTVAGATQLTITGGTVGGTTPNATLSISGGGISCPTGFTLSVGQCAWTQTASASSSLSWTGLSGNAYQLSCDGLIGGNGTVALGVQFGEGATPTWGTTSAYTYVNMYFTVGSGTALGASGTQTAIPAPFEPPTSGTVGERYDASFINLQSTTLNKMVRFGSGGLQSGTTGVVVTGTAWYTADTNAITAIRILDTQATPSTFSGHCTLVALR